MRKNLSENLRWHIIYYQVEEYMVNKIAKRLYISKTSIYKVFKIFKKWDYIKDPFSSRVSRKKLFTIKDILVKKKL